MSPETAKTKRSVSSARRGLATIAWICVCVSLANQGSLLSSTVFQLRLAPTTTSKIWTRDCANNDYWRRVLARTQLLDGISSGLSSPSSYTTENAHPPTTRPPATFLSSHLVNRRDRRGGRKRPVGEHTNKHKKEPSYSSSYPLILLLSLASFASMSFDAPLFRGRNVWRARKPPKDTSNNDKSQRHRFTVACSFTAGLSQLKAFIFDGTLFVLSRRLPPSLRP
jgi:hypothetical protein